MMRSILVGILIVTAVVVGAITFKWYQSGQATVAFGAPFELVQGNGEPITQAAFKGHPSAVFFGFTHCPEVCPTTLFELDGWLKALGDEGKDIRAYFVTIDPERDTPEIVHSYVTNVSDRIVGISGEPEKVQAMAKSFHVYFKRVDLENGDYTMDHTASVYLINSDGDFAGTIAYGENPDNAIAKLKRLAKG
jgi:protein SCO1/2